MSLKMKKQGKALLVLIIGSCLTLAVFFVMGRMQYEHDRVQLQSLSDSYARRIEMAAGYMLRKPKIITELVRLNPNDVRWFSRVAAALKDDPAVLSFQIMRNGQALAVYPADYKNWTFDDPAVNEALQKMQDMAIANTSGVLYGPVPLKDGTYGLFGIDPIYFYTNQNRFEYWGASLILLRVPDALQMADFESLLEAGYVYRVRSLTGPEWAPPVIAASEEPLQDNPVTSVIHIPNGQWILETSPVNGWLNLRGIIWELVAGLGISVLLALIVYTFLMLREEREVMRAQAETDPLTRLSNRRLLMDEITERCNSAPGHFLICYLDLNNFKQVNDTYGHDVGDELIKAASDRIRGALKEEDSLFRVGGDEFVAIVEPEKGEGWKARLELLDREMRQMFVFGDGKICIDISVSMGCAVYPQNAVRAEELLRLADMRMLENKERFAHN